MVTGYAGFKKVKMLSEEGIFFKEKNFGFEN